MNEKLFDKAKGCLIGLAIGDALGVDTEGMSPSEINEKYGFVTDFLTDNPVGSDDTEFAVFNAQLLLKYGKDLSSEMIADAWIKEIVSQGGTYKGAGFSELMAMSNLKKGLFPPLSGFHAHSWSDGLAMRVAPFGIVCPGDPKSASELAYKDGVVTHSYEGIYAGQAVAAAIAGAMADFSIDEIIKVSLEFIPEDSWTFRSIKKAVTIGSQSVGQKEALQNLYENISCGYYNWADLGAEAVALAFGIISASNGDFINSVLGGVNIGRDTDTIAAIAGSIIGAKNGFSALPEKWCVRIQNCKGKCIKIVKDIDIKETAEKLVKLIEE